MGSLLLPFQPPEATYIVESFWKLLFGKNTKRTSVPLFLGSSTAFLPISCDIGGTISSQCSPVLSCSSTIMQNFVILVSFLAPFPLSYLQPSLLLSGTSDLPLLVAGLFSPATSFHALAARIVANSFVCLSCL